MQNKKRGKLVLIFLLALLGMGGGWYFSQVRDSSTSKEFPSPISEKRIKRAPTLFQSLTNLFNPPPPVKKAREQPNWEDLQSEVEDIATNHDGTLGVYIKDMTSEGHVGHEENRVFYAASLNKVPLIIGALRAINEGKLSLDQNLTYLARDYEEGAGTIILDPPGTSFSLATVLTKAAKESDNAAKNMLFRYVPYSYIAQVLEEAKAPNTKLQTNLSTPKEIASIFILAYQTEFLSEQSREMFFDLLTDTVFEERLPQPLPEETRISHKIGSWPDTNAYHDCGVIFTENPYVICVMSENNGYTEAVEKIRQLSLLTYEALR